MLKKPSLPISFGLLVMASVVCAQELPDPFLEQIADDDGQIGGPDGRDQASATANEKSADDLAKELSNPNSPLATLTFKQTYTSFDGNLPGAGDQSSNVSLFQPVFPFPLGDSGTTNLFIRPAFAYVWQQPVFNSGTGEFENKSGWADIGFDVALGRTYDTGLVVVGGVQGTIPTNTDVSAGQWRLGPEFLVANIGEKGYWAVFPSHQWDVGGDNYDYSTSGLELFGDFIFRMPGRFSPTPTGAMTGKMTRRRCRSTFRSARWQKSATFRSSFKRASTTTPSQMTISGRIGR